MTRRIIGFANPDGTGRGNWAHASEHQVGRIKNCKSCGRPHMFPRYQATPDTRIPPVRLLNYLLAVAFLEVMVVLWALSELGVFS